MLVKVKLQDGGFIYRNVMRGNMRKMAKSIHSYFPNSSYPILEAVIFNALQKDQDVLVLYPPVTQSAEYTPYKGEVVGSNPTGGKS